MTPAESRSQTNLFGKLSIGKAKLKNLTADETWDRVKVCLDSPILSYFIISLS